MAAKMIGLEKLKARLAALPAAVKEPVNAQLHQEASDLVEELKAYAPASELESKSGDIRDSVRTYDTPSRELSVRIIADAKDAKGRTYTAHVEYGHRTAGGHHVPAKPWFWPIYRARKKAIKRRMSTAGRKAIKTAFPKETT